MGLVEEFEHLDIDNISDEDEDENITNDGPATARVTAASPTATQGPPSSTSETAKQQPAVPQEPSRHAYPARRAATSGARSKNKARDVHIFFERVPQDPHHRYCSLCL